MITKIIYGLAILGAFLTGASDCLKDLLNRLTETKNDIQIQTNCE